MANVGVAVGGIAVEIVITIIIIITVLIYVIVRLVLKRLNRCKGNTVLISLLFRYIVKRKRSYTMSHTPLLLSIHVETA